MNIIRKVVLALSGVAVATTALSGWTLAQAVASQAEVDSYASSDALIAHQVGALSTDFFTYDGALNMYVLVASTPAVGSKLVEDTYASALAARTSFGQDLTAASGATTDGALRTALAQVGSAIDAYDGFAGQVRTDVGAGRISAATTVQTVHNLDASNALTAALAAAGTRADQLAAARLDDLRYRQTTVVASSGVLAVSILAAMAGIAWFIVAALRPLRRVEDGLRALASSDLSARDYPAGDDEVGRMGAAMTRATATLRASLAAIGDNASTLAAASEELAANSAVIGQAAGQTAARAGSASTASRTVDASVQRFSLAAVELGASIGEIAQSTAAATEIVTTAVQIADATSTTIGRLGASSAEISGVVALIQGVAEQTNLLALNATIEAARAGDAGKGFAVVASEVKDLAQQTSHATTQITARIEEIQADTAAAVAAIAEITRVISDIHHHQTAISGAVDQQSATAAELGHSVTAAATGTADIAASIDAFADAAQTTKDSVAEAEHAGADLARMSASLQDLVTAFRL